MDVTTYEKMKKVKEDYHSRAIRIPGVHGTSIGLKEVAGKLTDTIAICIHLSKKKPLDKVAADERIPEEIEGFPTDVLEHEPPSLCLGEDRIRPLDGDKNKYRPLVGGCMLSAGRMYGTLGCMVKDRETRALYALTNSHLIGDSDGTRVYQPSKVVADEIGTVERYQRSSEVDAAVSNLDAYDDIGLAYILDIGYIAGTYTVTIWDLPYSVQKRGASTELRSGAVTKVNWSGISNGAPFTNQMYISPGGNNNFAEPGDSGSAIVGSGNVVVGLLWGIVDGMSQNPGVANPIASVCADLKIDVLTAKDAVASRHDSETMTGKLEAILSQSVRGRGYWNAWRRHRTYLFHMFHHIPRLQAIWLKTPQSELMDTLRAAVRDPDSKIPSTIGNQDTVQILEKLRDGLKRHLEIEGKDELKRQLDSLCQVIEKNVGRSWRKALGD